MDTTLKILLLEDNPADAEIIRRLLFKEIKGLDFRYTKNKNEFLLALDELVPDVILSDNSLPAFSASQALEIVNARRLKIPFILITGTVSEEFAVGIMKQGADDYILKDRLTRLPAAIKAALRHRQTENEKRLSEEQREFEHNNLRALINNTEDLMWSVDADFNLITFNDSFSQAVTGVSGASLTKGTSILSAQFTPEQINRYKGYYQRAIQGEIFTIIDHFISSSQKWIEISFYPIRQGDKVVGTACFSRDITQRLKAEHELRRLEQERLEQEIEEQKKITRAVFDAQERERNSIGLELHDNVNQILVGTNLMLSMAKSKPEKAQELITTSMKLLQDAILENRKIAHAFVAPNLETEGLLIQLRQLAADMLESAGLKVQFEFQYFQEDSLDNDRKVNIYRIAQEQCTNIVKYAKATAVNFELVTSGSFFRMAIRDNGMGMDPGKKAKGIGLRNISGRMDIFNGKVNIVSAPGSGFSLEITLPI